MPDQSKFGVYTFNVQVTLRRQDSRYDSTTLARYELTREEPCVNDVDARGRMREHLDEASEIVRGIVSERIAFEQHVAQLTAGTGSDADTIDA